MRGTFYLKATNTDFRVPRASTDFAGSVQGSSFCSIFLPTQGACDTPCNQSKLQHLTAVCPCPDSILSLTRCFYESMTGHPGPSSPAVSLTRFPCGATCFAIGLQEYHTFCWANFLVLRHLMGFSLRLRVLY